MNKRSLSVLILASAAGFAVLPYGAAVAGGLVEAGELEHARANARAGGPVSEQDADLLKRYGCTSGTNSPACHQGYSGRRYYRHRTYKHRRHRY
jgi:hypothetical protein